MITNFFHLISTIAALSYAALAQSQLESCKTACRELRGKCDVDLFALARKPCLDTRSNTERTCNCNLNFDQLQALSEGDVVRDCVIPQPLLSSGAATIRAKLVNVHINSISAGASLDQRGDIIRSTICKWTCTGRNRFQNCRMGGNVIRSTMGDMIANDQAALVIGSRKFFRNNVDRLDADGTIQIACQEGFANNNVNVLITRIEGEFSSVLGTKIENNSFAKFITGSIQSFADLENNTAVQVILEGPCNVLNKGSPIDVTGFFGVPADDRDCLKMFRKA